MIGRGGLKRRIFFSPKSEGGSSRGKGRRPPVKSKNLEAHKKRLDLLGQYRRLLEKKDELARATTLDVMQMKSVNDEARNLGDKLFKNPGTVNLELVLLEIQTLENRIQPIEGTGKRH